MSQESLERVEIYSALNKPNLVFGADRELMLMSGVVAFALFFTGLTMVTTVTAIVLLLVSHFFLKLMAKNDPMMRQIFLKQLKYSKFYFARSTPFVMEQ
jgi:type IV secretion system protein VirB3